MARPVTTVELDVIDQQIREAQGGDRTIGILVRRRLVEIAGELTRWQWVQHGDTSSYRQMACRFLCECGKLKVARRFALCGRGDQIGISKGNGLLRLRTKGCGKRYCPRCSRRAGRRFVNKVGQVLGARPHGSLWHVVLTQRAIPGEELDKTRRRFERAWNRMRRSLKERGLVGGLSTYHLTRNQFGAWHWHMHLIAEMPGGVQEAEFGQWSVERWAEIRGESPEHGQGAWMRPLAEAGEALTGLHEPAQMEFFIESTSKVERVLQYAVRDVLQGVERWVEGVRTEEDVQVFVKTLAHCKMHRLLGDWRKKPEQAEAATEAPASAPKVAGAAESEEIEWYGNVDVVLYRASRGIEGWREVALKMNQLCKNRGNVALRLSTLLRDL